MKNILFTPPSSTVAQIYDNNLNSNLTSKIYYTLDWVEKYTPVPLSASADYIKAITKDKSGNIYVVGDCYFDSNKIILITIKINSQGKIDWINRYDGKYVPNVYAKDIGVDNEGNIYVCGHTKGNYLSHDYIIIKYNSLGFQVWERYFNGPTNNYDEPIDMKVDDAGNVYVTGVCYSNETNCNIATVKFNKFGNFVYSIIYDGPNQKYDYPAALETDSKGNVYITGFSEGVNTGYDFITIKYDTLGRQIWNFRYNSDLNINDYSKFIAIDKNGDVYIAGISEGKKIKIVTIKLNNNGENQWIASYGSEESYNVDVADMAIDYSGNIIIAARIYNIGNLPKALMVKYNSNGKLVWIREYNMNNCEPIALTIDEYDNIYLTGSTTSAESSTDILTMKCDTAGLVQWFRIYNNRENNIDEPVGIVLNNSGSVSIAGYSRKSHSFEDLLLINYDCDGVLNWVITKNIFGGGIAYVDDMVLDKFNNIYVVGKERINDTICEYITLKYNQLGELQWMKKDIIDKYNENHRMSVALDSFFNVYVLGTVESVNNLSDIFLVKYDQFGEKRWMRKYNGNASMEDVSVAVSIDQNQYIYVTGYSKMINRSYDFVTMKYDQDGNTLWIRTFGSLGECDDRPIDICIDNFGSIYITGESILNDSYSVIKTINYDANGELNWIANFGLIGRNSPVAIECDNKGYVYVTGYCFNNQRGYDYVTIKYSALNGMSFWQKYYNGLANSNDYPTNIVVGGDGDVYVTGKSQGGASMYDFVTIKYNPFGVEQWINRYNGSGNMDDVPRSIFLDQKENLFITGLSYITYPQAVTIIYDRFGNERNKFFYTDNNSNKVEPIKLVVDSQNNFILCLNEYSFNWSKFSIIKYKKTPETGLIEVEDNKNISLSLFPNPFNNTVNILYSLKENSTVSIFIYDINGKLIKSILNDVQRAGNFQVQWNCTNEQNEIVANGIYILQLKTTSSSEYKKLLLIK